LIEVIGAIREDRKDEFLGNALGLLFSIDWPEPFWLGFNRGDGLASPVGRRTASNNRSFSNV
jgi:hypothetical protein